MTQSIPDQDGPSLAAEYVLGLLSQQEARDFEAVLAVDPDVRDDYAAWAETFASFTNDIPAVAPPKSLENKIKTTLWGPQEVPVSIWDRFRGFGTAVAVGVAAIALFAIFVQTDVSQPSGPVYVAEIAADDQSLIVQARFDADAGILEMTRDAGGAREGRVMEVWLIAGDNAPVSLGVWPQGQSLATLTIDPDLADQFEGGLLAISDEPVGGSPTGLPTGDVMAAGTISLS